MKKPTEFTLRVIASELCFWFALSIVMSPGKAIVIACFVVMGIALLVNKL